MVLQNLEKLLRILIHSPVEFVLVGGLAAVVHGCNQTTRDIDICILSQDEQLVDLKTALKDYHPCFRDNDEQISFLDQSIASLRNRDLHLKTDLGILDVVQHIEAIGSYPQVVKGCDEIDLYEGKCRVISIEDLIKSKKALGRHRDLLVAMELEEILKEKLN